MIDLKNYNKAIKVHSQEELDECYRIFTEAGADVSPHSARKRYKSNQKHLVMRLIMLLKNIIKELKK